MALPQKDGGHPILIGAWPVSPLSHIVVHLNNPKIPPYQLNKSKEMSRVKEGIPCLSGLRVNRNSRRDEQQVVKSVKS